MKAKPYPKYHYGGWCDHECPYYVDNGGTNKEYYIDDYCERYITELDHYDGTLRCRQCHKEFPETRGGHHNEEHEAGLEEMSEKYMQDIIETERYLDL